jgi:bifunctional non-homologous end joining protein LigD
VRTATTLEVEGTPVRVTSADRVLWPATGTTKRDLIAYAQSIAPVILPHLADRVVAFHRFPEGVDATHFYEIRCPPHPPWVRTVTQRPPTGKVFDMAVIDSTAALVWTANLSAIELHPYLHRVHSPDAPDVLLLDLDPGPPAGVVATARLALLLRDLLETQHLTAHVKTSGGKGLHVVAPLPPGHTYDGTKALARALAGTLAELAPADVTLDLDKDARRGKVRLDWGQNDAWKSTVAPYSLRGMRAPTVSMPVTWDEVEQAASTGDARLLTFGPADVHPRLDAHGDLFAAVLPTTRVGG